MASDQNKQSLGDVLAKALDQEERIREAVMPPPVRAMPSLHELAKNDDATAFVKAWRAKYRD
jgi:hypothetical protein